jgi:predicted alpha/beta-hydrolase family hydrolase
VTETTEIIEEGPKNGPLLILAHGAGAPMNSPFMDSIGARLAAHGLRVVRFEFDYMAARRKGMRRPPDREPLLRYRWLETIHRVKGTRPAFIGGKSMGGRIATLVADEAEVDGVVCFGFPFHPPGRAAAARLERIQELRTPTLILQGTRDSLGSRDEVSKFKLSPAITIRWIDDGDHSLKPRKSSGRTEEQNLDEAASAAAEFILGRK